MQVEGVVLKRRGFMSVVHQRELSAKAAHWPNGQIIGYPQLTRVHCYWSADQATICYFLQRMDLAAKDDPKLCLNLEPQDIKPGDYRVGSL